MMKDLYQPHLDALRGVMAMWVFVYHAAILCGFTTRVIPPGGIAVEVFMFLSGLLMTANFLARQIDEPISSARTIFAFLIRRFFRIAPLYYTLLAVALVFYKSFDVMSHDLSNAFPPEWAGFLERDPSQREPTIANILTHITFVYGLFPQYAANNALPDWSLSLEMQFYLAIPFILLLARRFGLTAVVSTLFFIEIASSHYIGNITSLNSQFVWPQPSLLPLKINCFMAGVLAAAYYYDKRRDTFILMFILMFLHQHPLFSGTTLFCFLAMSESHETPIERFVFFIKKMMSGHTWRFFGDISYGVYLVHFPIIIPLTSLLLKFDGYKTMPPIVRFMILLASATAIVIPIAFVLHRRIELPGIKIGRRMAKKLRDRHKVADSAMKESV